jgi:hypothetical protein
MALDTLIHFKIKDDIEIDIPYLCASMSSYVKNLIDTSISGSTISLPILTQCSVELLITFYEYYNSLSDEDKININTFCIKLPDDIDWTIPTYIDTSIFLEFYTKMINMTCTDCGCAIIEAYDAFVELDYIYLIDFTSKLILYRIKDLSQDDITNFFSYRS